MSKVAFEEYKKQYEKERAAQLEEDKKEVKAWTKEEQKALELAIKKYPSTLPAAERWKKIAEEIPGGTRSAKDCVDRVKEVKKGKYNNDVDKTTNKRKKEIIIRAATVVTLIDNHSFIVYRILFAMLKE